MKFKCEIETTEGREKWNGEIKRIVNHGSHCELLIESRSSILVLYGRTTQGGFACMPDYEVGCHLVDLKDKFWNEEKLCSVLGLVDGITTATALYRLSEESHFENLMVNN